VKTILSVVGARPQFIKAAPVSRAIALHPEIRELLVHTGQHYDEMMSAVFFDELGIPAPWKNLEIGSGSHGEQTGRMLIELERVFIAEKPDAVLVYGDTNSTLAGAVSAVKLGIPVAHVEAGFRCFDVFVPEEANRLTTDHLSTLLFAPTETTVRNLSREGITRGVFLTGDVMYDAALMFGQMALPRFAEYQRLGLESGDYVLATLHRPAHADDRDVLELLLTALATLARSGRVVLPLHPRTRAKLGLSDSEFAARFPGILLLPPVGYLDMLALEQNAKVIVTDSGGVQRESFFFRKPCVTIRAFHADPEWPELVTAGWNRYIWPNTQEAVVDAVADAIRSTPHELPNLFGDGAASGRIAEELVRWLVTT
jgi:UDP-GlcNAc3NAcA epimerase